MIVFSIKMKISVNVFSATNQEDNLNKASILFIPQRKNGLSSLVLVYIGLGSKRNMILTQEKSKWCSFVDSG